MGKGTTMLTHLSKKTISTSPRGRENLAAGLANGSGPHTSEGAGKMRRKAKAAAWRIVVAGETVISSEGMAAILRRDSRFNICAVVHEQALAAEMLHSHDPDLLLLEPFTDLADGIQRIKDLTAQFPRTRILVVSRPPERLYAERALRAGALAWFGKDGTIDELFRAMEAVISGVPARSLAKQGRASYPDLNALSDRELHIFSLVAAGRGIGHIAGELGISRKTVETHCEHIKLKLGYRDADALRQGARTSLGSR
jgi:two-component system response regulator NreC